jgi:UDP-glucose 4-epimerase
MAKILITGGCGYIGSHTIIDLIEQGFEVVSVDSNIRSDAKMLEAVAKITGKQVKNYAVDICDSASLKAVFEAEVSITGIIHFAAYKSVPESVAEPLKYYHNNIQGLVNVLDCVKAFKVPNFIFSSSCSVYGNVTELPVKESTPLNRAESPYARTKQMCEEIIQDFTLVTPETKAILLRYFNPGGAHPSGLLGEIPQVGAYNVIPILIESLIGKRGQFTVHGGDYTTRDGTCIRDYIYIMDLADAHTKSIQYLLKTADAAPCSVFNVGIGQGVTVLELIQAFEQAAGKSLDYVIGPRRAGDVASIYADYSRAKNLLNWSPKGDVHHIMQTSWQWYQNALLDSV